MRHNGFSLNLRAILTFCTAVVFLTNGWAASHQVLHSFNPGGSDAAYPFAGLVADAAGNLYGTTFSGGTYNVGTVFEMSPQEGGGWTEKLLYSFNNNGQDGFDPEGSLIFDGAGNLYGTTQSGGIHAAGTVFELSPNGGGGWTETVLHSFGRGTDGTLPYAALVFDSSGNLYTTTQGGGIDGLGAVVELSPRQGGGWTETVIHSLGNGTDGYTPLASMIVDAAGNLYGTTQQGGIHNDGTVFELSPRQGGGWTETVLHSFGNDSDGSQPYANLMLDGSGNLYGTTIAGGIHGYGAVFELSPNGSGGWTETLLHSFGNGTDGTAPEAGLIHDAAGNLYGTTASGGIHSFGTAFELSPKQGGGWTETVLHSFNTGGDGVNPIGALIIDGAGNLYSSTLNGGISEGSVFELSPRQGGGWSETVLYSFNFNGTDGGDPAYTALVSDAAGNLYGTAGSGGIYDSGIAFELSPNGGGGWTETVLYNFGKGTEGSGPDCGLIFDAAGNLYGTTTAGGIHNKGTVFELLPNGNGSWTNKVLHSFDDGSDGAYPFAALVFDHLGNLYGTTYQGGIHGRGTVFEVSPNGSGGWSEKVLHSFNLNGVDAALPYAPLTIDAAGNLYGVTAYGGIYYGSGAVFEVSPNGSGGWTEKVLHSFGNGNDGAVPISGLLLDAANNLYGTTYAGGIHGNGAVFELTPRQNGSWSERLLHSFAGTDGAYPQSNLIFLGANLYGTTYGGGVAGTGTVFEMIPTQGGNWSETVLHNFGAAYGADGAYPDSGLLSDSAGNLYGTTNLGGGTYNSGTVFEVGP